MIGTSAPKKLKTALLLLSLLLMFSRPVKASHIFGGEITWVCLGSGQYQFEVRVYIDCTGGITPNWTAINVYGHPTICSIPINPALTQTNDVSPAGCSINCNNPMPGAVLETIFKTNPITIPGVPPATGWTFAIDDFARSTLANLNGGGQGITLHSVMFPNNGANTNPCFDSSPYFAERPLAFACIGYPFTYNPNGIDVDGDSLAYSWANCLDQPTSATCSPFVAPVINYGPAPYTLQNPLPGNVTLNASSGSVNFFVPATPAVIGNFASCIKVTSYRQGIKIAEVYRDCSFTLINNCLVQGVFPNNINVPPVITKPFGQGISNDTIIIACDTVRFAIQATDFQQNLPSSPQTITLTASGQELGNPTNTNSGCNNPPCAELSKLLPHTSALANFVGFTWATEADLLDSVAICHGTQSKTYYFVIKANDNFCPAPAYVYSTIGITIIRPPVFQLNNSVWVSSRNALSYQWYFNCNPIPGATDSLYSFTASGTYECLIQTKNGCPLFSQFMNVVYVGVNEIEKIQSLSIVPNPAKGKFTLYIGSLVTETVDIVFSDVVGRVTLAEKVQLKMGNNIFEYSANRFSSGVYFVKAGKGRNAITQKIIIE